MDRIDRFLSDCRWLRIGFSPGGLTENPPPHALQRYLALPSLVLPMETKAPLVPTGTRWFEQRGSGHVGPGNDSERIRQVSSATPALLLRVKVSPQRLHLAAGLFLPVATTMYGLNAPGPLAAVPGMGTPKFPQIGFLQKFTSIPSAGGGTLGTAGPAGVCGVWLLLIWLEECHTKAQKSKPRKKSSAAFYRSPP